MDHGHGTKSKFKASQVISGSWTWSGYVMRTADNGWIVMLTECQLGCLIAHVWCLTRQRLYAWGVWVWEWGWGSGWEWRENSPASFTSVPRPVWPVGDGSLDLHTNASHFLPQTNISSEYYFFFIHLTGNRSNDVGVDLCHTYLSFLFHLVFFIYFIFEMCCLYNLTVLKCIATSVYTLLNENKKRHFQLAYYTYILFIHEL